MTHHRIYMLRTRRGYIVKHMRETAKDSRLFEQMRRSIPLSRTLAITTALAWMRDLGVDRMSALTIELRAPKYLR